MMIDPQVHLTDEELLAVRDGACRNGQLLAHVGACDYCQAVLAEWRRFHEKVAASSPSPLMQEFNSLVYAKRALQVSVDEDSIARFSLTPEPPAPPPSWLEAARQRLGQASTRHSLGTLTLYMMEDSSLHLEADAAAQASSNEVVYALGNVRLHLGTRQAGFSMLLVARLEGPWMTAHAADYDLTLVPARGAPRMQPLMRDSLPGQGLTWFALTGGESTLLIHLDETWQLRLRKEFSSRV